MSEISIRCLLEFGTSNEVRFNLPTPPVVLSLVGSFLPSFPNPSAFVFLNRIYQMQINLFRTNRANFNQNYRINTRGDAQGSGKGNLQKCD